MTMPRKGTRSIDVEGKKFRWKLRKWVPRFKGTSPRTHTLVVEAEDGGLVSAFLLSTKWNDREYFLNDEEFMMKHKASITPGNVKSFVCTCLERDLIGPQRARKNVDPDTVWCVGDYCVVAR